MILVWKKVVDGLAIAFVTARTNHAPRLVKGDHENVSPCENLTTETDSIVISDPNSGRLADGAIDTDFAFLNLAISLPAREFGARGDVFVKADFFHRGGDKKAEPLGFRSR
jgi:hypothetical protein